MKKIVLLVCFVCATIVNGVAADPDYTEALKVYKSYLDAIEEKSIGKMMEALDPNSPTYAQTLEQAATSMLNTNMKFNITAAKSIGKSGEYLLLRIVQVNSVIKTENKDVEIDSVQMFRKDSETDKWLLRSSVIITAKATQE